MSVRVSKGNVCPLSKTFLASLWAQLRSFIARLSGGKGLNVCK